MKEKDKENVKHCNKKKYSFDLSRLIIIIIAMYTNGYHSCEELYNYIKTYILITSTILIIILNIQKRINHMLMLT